MIRFPLLAGAALLFPLTAAAQTATGPATSAPTPRPAAEQPVRGGDIVVTAPFRQQPPCPAPAPGSACRCA